MRFAVDKLPAVTMSANSVVGQLCVLELAKCKVNMPNKSIYDECLLKS